MESGELNEPFVVRLGGRARTIRSSIGPGRQTALTVDGKPGMSGHVTDGQVVIFDRGNAVAFDRQAPTAAGGGGSASDGALRAPMPGKIVAAPVKAGDAVTKGQPVVVLEAMKMEHALTAPFDGVVVEIAVGEGDQVAADAVLARVEAA